MLVGDGLQACCRERVVRAIWWVEPQSLVDGWNWRKRSGNDGMRIAWMDGTMTIFSKDLILSDLWKQ